MDDVKLLRKRKTTPFLEMNDELLMGDVGGVNQFIEGLIDKARRFIDENARSRPTAILYVDGTAVIGMMGSVPENEDVPDGRIGEMWQMVRDELEQHGFGEWANKIEVVIRDDVEPGYKTFGVRVAIDEKAYEMWLKGKGAAVNV